MKGKTIISTQTVPAGTVNPGESSSSRYSADAGTPTPKKPKANKGKKIGPRRPLTEGSPFGECRPTRAACESPKLIASYAPEGSAPTVNMAAWLRAVAREVTASGLRADWQHRTLVVARVLISFRNGPLPTCSPLWADALERAGVSRATFNNKLHWLMDRGLLSHIAYGRQEHFKPAWVRARDGEAGNDKAVYGFCLPVPAESPADREDELKNTITETPVRELTHARGARDCMTAPQSKANIAFASLRTSTKGGSAALRDFLLSRKDDLLGLSQTAKLLGSRGPSRKSQALFAASVIGELPFLAKRISPPHLASILRELKIFDADWTVNDVLYALKARPEEGEWQYGDAVGHVAGWVRFRLNAWIGEDGRPIKSKGQREREAMRRSAEERAAAAIQRKKDDELRARNYAIATGAAEPGIGWLAFKAQREALRKAGNGFKR